MRLRLRAAAAMLVLTGALFSPCGLRAADDQVNVVYPSVLQPLVSKIALPFAEASGVTIVGRAVSSATDAPDTNTRPDVVLSTDLWELRRALPVDRAPTDLVFAADAIVLAYAEESAFARAVKDGTLWFTALASEWLGFGRADPDESALGLRTLFVLQLASRHYDHPDLALKVLRPGQTMPAEVLVRRLSASTLDAALLYRSLATRAGLPRLDLPIEINLGDPERAGLYAEASIDLDGHVRRGAPILLAATALEGSPGASGAAKLLAFLASPDAAKLLTAAGYVVPPGLPRETDRRAKPKAD
ncbi:MAG: substrate-binding domain-containing protein [Candidatus Binatia bacterium]|nr:substrate-binding domain-containing protein [Candidatus Binatia bacterium]